MADLLHSSPRAEVWLGSCLDEAHVQAVMGERKADLICLDAPYSRKCHEGHDAGKRNGDSLLAYARRHEGAATPESRYANRSALGEGRRELNYPHWSEIEIGKFCELWVPRSCGWVVSITDDVLAPMWSASLDASGLYVFAPLPLVESGSRCRMAGDGPSNWTTWVVVARPRTPEFRSWGTLPGAYVQPAERDFNRSDSGREPHRVVGGKPLSAMIRIVSDYSRRGGLVVDPTCGGGTTLKAAIASGRRAIGMDVMREHAELTVRNIQSTREQTNLFEVST